MRGGMRRLILTIFLAAVMVGGVCGDLIAAAASRPTSRPAPKTPASRPGGVVQLKHLRIDRTGGQVVVDAAVALQEGALEFVLCTAGTKDYESLLTTRASPSSLHAALLALGLAPGKPARWVTPAGRKGVFVPPSGALLEITVRWKAKGALREVPVTDWMLAAGTQKTADPTRWVFVGSDLLDDGRYWADVEGHHVSVANFASSVVDVPFKSSDKTAFLEFLANPAAMPAGGTRVELVIKLVKGAETAPAARITFNVDLLGRIKMDGRPIAPESIADVVKKFLSRHAAGSADVRVDPRALVFDRDRLNDILQQAGLTDITFRMSALDREVLPRTFAQTAEALAWWKDRFSRAGDLIMDPAEDAAATLRHIQRRRKQFEDLSELWADYAARLRDLLADHRARKQKEKKSKP